MNRLLFTPIGVLLLLASSLTVSAQGTFRDRATAYLGFGLDLYPITYTDPFSPYENVTAAANVIKLGGEYNLRQSDDLLALNFRMGFDLGFQYNPYADRGLNFNATVPLYLVGRIGAGATSFTQAIVGFGLGVGVKAGYASSTFDYRSTFFQTDALWETGIFMPSVTADLVFNPNGGSFILRGEVGLLQRDTEVVMEQDIATGQFDVPQDAEFYYYSLALIYFIPL